MGSRGEDAVQVRLKDYYTVCFKVYYKGSDTGLGVSCFRLRVSGLRRFEELVVLSPDNQPSCIHAIAYPPKSFHNCESPYFN